MVARPSLRRCMSLWQSRLALRWPRWWPPSTAAEATSPPPPCSAAAAAVLRRLLAGFRPAHYTRPTETDPPASRVIRCTALERSCPRTHPSSTAHCPPDHCDRGIDCVRCSVSLVCKSITSDREYSATKGNRPNGTKPTRADGCSAEGQLS